MSVADEKVLQQVRDLVKLANDDEDSEESRTAAMKATRMMKQHELVLIPKSEIDRVQKMVEGAQQLARQHASERNQDRMMGGIVGLLLAKQLKF